jgi:hypothetical protein
MLNAFLWIAFHHSTALDAASCATPVNAAGLTQLIWPSDAIAERHRSQDCVQRRPAAMLGDASRAG